MQGARCETRSRGLQDHALSQRQMRNGWATPASLLTHTHTRSLDPTVTPVRRKICKFELHNVVAAAKQGTMKTVHDNHQIFDTIFRLGLWQLKSSFALWCLFYYFFKFYLFIHRNTHRERDAEAQAEGEAGSMQGARCETRSRVPRITPQAAGRC